ncbi:MAG: hypothetical protein J6Q82_02755 [Clostridia bacterium]|nr:hypothetical protein [Clostridia bacterium]
MKKRFQKLTSFALVLVMLVTMLPMGVLTATAEGEVSAELAAGLAAGSQNLVIKSVADWKAVSAATSTYTSKSGASFSGTTITLGADIDANGEALPPLSTGAFYGVLDGQGYTVKNATVTGSGNTGLIAGALGGGKVTNVNFDNITLTTSAGHLGLIAGHNSIWAEVEISKINATNITVTNTGTGNTGGIIGNHANNGYTQVVTQINFQGTVRDDNTAAGCNVGGIVGAASIGGVTKWSKISLDATVGADQTGTTDWVGGFAGLYGMNAGKLLEVSDVYLSGAIDGNSVSTPQNAGFIAKVTGQAGANMSVIDGVLIDMDFSKAFGNSIIFAAIQNGNLVYTNAFTTMQSNNGTWSSSTVRWTNMSYNGNSFFNGVANPWAGADPTRDSLTRVNATEIDDVVTRDSDGFIADVAAPENLGDPKTIVINSIEDWKTVSEMNDLFEGMTVKLGADIDAAGATLPQLFKAGNVRCTFDGQGYTIKNVGTAAAPNTVALLSSKSNLNIQNVTVENCHVSGSGDKAVLVDWQNCWSKYTFKNIKVFDSTVVSSDKAAGIIIGQVSGNAGNYGVDFENILISGCSATGKSNGGGWSSTGVGSLAGYCVFNSGDYGASAKNIEVLKTTLTDNAEASCVGGLFGYFRHHGGTSLTIENVYVNATFKTPKSSGWTGVAAGLFQTANSNTGNVNTIKNCITNNQYPGIVQFPTLFYAPQATFVWENLYSVQAHNPLKAGWLINGNNVVNGVEGVVSNYNGIPAEQISIASIRSMIVRDEDGFISKIKSVVEPYGYHCSEVKDGKFAVRFLGTASLIEERVVYVNVKATTESGVVRTFRVQSPLFERVTPFDKHSIDDELIAKTIGTEKLICVTVYDIPVGEAIEFEIWMSMEASGGLEINSTETMTFRFDANGAPIVE